MGSSWVNRFLFEVQTSSFTYSVLKPFGLDRTFNGFSTKSPRLDPSYLKLEALNQVFICTMILLVILSFEKAIFLSGTHAGLKT